MISSTGRRYAPPRPLLQFKSLHKNVKARTRRVYIFVDILPENWNQLESYVFDAYEMIKALNEAIPSKELSA